MPQSNAAVVYRPVLSFTASRRKRSPGPRAPTRDGSSARGRCPVVRVHRGQHPNGGYVLEHVQDADLVRLLVPLTGELVKSADVVVRMGWGDA